MAVLLGRPAEDPQVRAAHADVLADPATADLLGRLTDWETDQRVTGHDKPTFLPNLLALLADLGVGPEDDPRIGGALQAMLAHQDADGRFQSLGSTGGRAPVWASLPCDHHAVLETLARAGLASHPAVRRGFQRLLDDLGPTRQGPGWECRPDPAVGFRGPGRKGDVCPQVTLEALRALSYVPELAARPEIGAAVHTALGVWRDRGLAKPYMFGHGRAFKQGKWPATWYSALSLVDAVGRHRHTWQGADADPADTAALTELVAVLLAYVAGPDGRVVPRSVFRGFERHTFGQRRTPSDVATALLAVVLARVEPLRDAAAQVDVGALTSSKGGSGTALPPS